MDTKHIVLCGGSGSRLKGESLFDKPLGLVLGRPLIEYVIESIDSDELTLIAGNHLRKYNLDTVIHHLTKKKIDFIYVDRPTRGPVETAFLGLKKLKNISGKERIVFYDNDTIYKNVDFPKDNCNAIGYLSINDPTKTYPYCFLKLKEDQILSIHEKNQVSKTYAAGIYMFESIDYFQEKAKSLIKEMQNGEVYMSTILNEILNSQGKSIKGFKIEDGICLGSKEDVINNLNKIAFKQLRICFDLDNTLLKYRMPGETYADCKPIEDMINILKKLHRLGHKIIIHTARGMATAKQNNGSALSRVGKDTFDILESLKIPYDEIYFGKPNADVYVDDKSHNPFFNFYNSIGFPQLEEPKLNPTNKFNSILIGEEIVTKTGPSASMRGEIYFYKTISNLKIRKYYPNYINSNIDSKIAKLNLERIHGFELYKLLKDELLEKHHLDKLSAAFREIHSAEGELKITANDIYENYMGKLKRRFKNKEDYPFSDTQNIINKIDPIIKDYLFSDNLKISAYVHGDPWFSNTMLDVNSNIKFLDMKGDIAGEITTNGDPLTDYCKIMQSLFGFDYIINNEEFNTSYLSKLRAHFENSIIDRGYKIETINAISACLIAKTISFFETGSPFKKSIWELACKISNRI